jgi:Protein of unknown function (DUF559)
VHHVRVLAPHDVTVPRRIPVTSVARTLADLAAVLDAHQLERAVHQAVVLRLLDARALREAAKGRPGAIAVSRVLADPDPGHAHAGLEERFLALCRRARLPLPRLNTHLPLPDRLVELDGAAVHHTRRAFQEDRRRDAALAAEGYAVVRLTWQRVEREPGAVVVELRRILEQRGRLAA